MPSSYSKPNGILKSGTQRYKPDQDKYLYNVDTFWYNVGAENYAEIMDDGLRDLLIKGREYNSDYDDSMVIEIPLEGYSNPIEFEILHGQKPLYQYSIRNNDIAIYFSKNVRDGQLPMKVQINQFILWEKGLYKAYLESKSILESFGFNVDVTKLNRVDFAVHSDQFQWKQEDFKTFEYPRNIAMDNFPDWKRLDPNTGSFETVYFGSRSSCLLRIYNKSIEVKKKKKDYFLDLYESKGMDVDNVWNVEFEVHRQFIKECKDLEGARLFDDLEDVFKEDRLSLLWSYLMKMYNHKSAHWTQLKKGKKGIFEKSTGYLDRRKDNNCNAYRETAQIRGRLMTFVMNDGDYSFEKALSKFIEMNRDYEESTSKSWIDDVEKRKSRFHDEAINGTIGQVVSCKDNEVQLRKENREKARNTAKDISLKESLSETVRKRKDAPRNEKRPNTNR